MKVIYKKETLEILEIFIVKYPPFTLKGKSYESDTYIAVRTELYTFEINGKSKVFNIINDIFLPADYLNRICKYSGKLKIIFETTFEKSYFDQLK